MIFKALGGTTQKTTTHNSAVENCRKEQIRKSLFSEDDSSLILQIPEGNNMQIKQNKKTCEYNPEVLTHLLGWNSLKMHSSKIFNCGLTKSWTRCPQS